MLRTLTVLLLVSFSLLSVPAQEPKSNPEEKPRKVKREPKKAYVEWIKDHDLILTQSERDAWKKLDTDDEREKFIEEIWRVRDPDPNTEENEFKLQFYERVAYANEHFSSGKDGRFTDRGRIYIKFGKPDSIESHPSGKQVEDWRQINDAGQRLTLSRLIDTRALEPGEYQVQIRIRDHVTGQTITPSATFTVVP